MDAATGAGAVVQDVSLDLVVDNIGGSGTRQRQGTGASGAGRPGTCDADGQCKHVRRRTGGDIKGTGGIDRGITDARAVLVFDCVERDAHADPYRSVAGPAFGISHGHAEGIGAQQLRAVGGSQRDIATLA